MSSRLGLSLLLAVPLLSLGCAPQSDERVARAKIGPGGGQVSSHDGVLTVLILPGALDREHEFVITPSDTPPHIFGPAYRVKPDVDLAVDAEITYARALPNDPDGTAVAAIGREDFASGAGSWIALPTIEVDVEAQLISGLDGEVSLFYGLLEGDDISGTTGSTTSTPTGDTGDTDDTDDTGAPQTTTDEDTDTETTSPGDPLSHASDIQPIWDDNCMGQGCHSAGQSAPQLEGDAYDAIVGVMPLAAAVPYITAGDPQASYLMHKLDATHALEANLGGCGCGGAGAPMPSGAPLLDESVRNRVRRWIEEGAQP